MGKKSRRREKKPKELKSEKERKEEMDTIKEKLTSLGLSPEMEGIDEFYEVGPGRVLRGLLRRIQRKITCHTLG